VRTTVTHVIASAIPRTDRTNRSGRRLMFARANRTRHRKVLPDAVAISGGRVIVGGAADSTEGMVGALCFVERYLWYLPR
jgi:hypothetical protein